MNEQGSGELEAMEFQVSFWHPTYRRRFLAAVDNGCPVSKFKNALPFGALLHQVEPVLLRQSVHLMLGSVVDPSRTQVDLAALARGFHSECLSPNTVQRLEDDARHTSLVEFKRALEAAEAGSNDHDVCL